MSTSIAWTDETCNPIRGIGSNRWICQKVSPGCDHCYSERLNTRWGGLPFLGAGKPLDLVAANLIRLDLKAFDKIRRLKKPSRVFVCDMTDLFGEWVPVEWIWEAFNAFDSMPQHTFQVLTKRAKRMRDVVVDWQSHGYRLGPNVWLGVSVESQEYAWRLNYLSVTPAAVRFVSAEPLLGPLELKGQALFPDWVIVGGESGPGYRPMNLQWARDLKDQCDAAGVAYFFKQAGGPRPGMGEDALGGLFQAFPDDERGE